MQFKQTTLDLRWIKHRSVVGWNCGEDAFQPLIGALTQVEKNFPRNGLIMHFAVKRKYMSMGDAKEEGIKLKWS